MWKLALLFIIITCVCRVSGKALPLQEEEVLSVFAGLPEGDTLRLPVKENRDNEIRSEVPASPLFLKKPSNIRDTVIYNPQTRRYIVMTLIGDKYYYSRPYALTSDEYLHSTDKVSLYEYNRRKREEGNKTDFKDLVSQIQFLDKILSPIFGINKVKLNVQGSVELTKDNSNL